MRAVVTRLKAAFTLQIPTLRTETKSSEVLSPLSRA